MKTNKLIPLILTAALALSACASAAETATAAEPATTPEATAEPTSKPAGRRPAHSILTATAMRRMLSMMSCPLLMTSWTISERKFTKTT